MDFDAKLLDEARKRRDEARRAKHLAEMMLDEAETEYNELNNAMKTFERVHDEHTDFTRDAFGG